MPWPSVTDNPGPPAPGRYCLATCYCGQCDHYEPIPSPRRRIRAAQNRPTRDTRWGQREDPTWIDQM